MSEHFSEMWNLTVGFPQVAAWTKYWVALCGDQLYYYPAKSLKATERKHVGHTSRPHLWYILAGVSRTPNVLKRV